MTSRRCPESLLYVTYLRLATSSASNLLSRIRTLSLSPSYRHKAHSSIAQLLEGSIRQCATYCSDFLHPLTLLWTAGTRCSRWYRSVHARRFSSRRARGWKPRRYHRTPSDYSALRFDLGAGVNFTVCFGGTPLLSLPLRNALSYPIAEPRNVGRWTYHRGVEH